MDSLEGGARGRIEGVKGALDEVVRAIEEAANVPGKRLEEIMLLSEAWMNTPTPPGPPQSQQ